MREPRTIRAPILRIARSRTSAIAVLALLCIRFADAADLASPIGLWKTVDDRSGAARALVSIYESRGRYFGRIEKTFDTDEADARCTACTDERKDQPIVGLVIVRNVERRADGFGGGDILDPESGSIYRCSFTIADQGRTLEVRGYLGVSLFGRTQRWSRER